MDQRERFAGVLGEVVRRGLEQPGRLLGQHQNTIPWSPIECEDEISRGERGIDRDSRFHAEGKIDCDCHVAARKQGQAVESMLPVDAGDKFAQVLNEGSDFALFEFPVEPLQALRHQVFDDDPVALVRGGRSMGGGQHRNRGIIVVLQETFQLGAADHVGFHFAREDAEPMIVRRYPTRCGITTEAYARRKGVETNPGSGRHNIAEYSLA